MRKSGLPIEYYEDLYEAKIKGAKMTKYKECDAAKSIEDFKVGDRIVAYCGRIPIRGEIVSIEKDWGLLFMKNVNGQHWKSCRKLLPVEPRVVWIKKNDLKNPDCPRFRLASPDEKFPEDWIKFQECVDLGPGAE